MENVSVTAEVQDSPVNNRIQYRSDLSYRHHPAGIIISYIKYIYIYIYTIR